MEDERFATYRRHFEYAIDRIDANFSFVFYRMSTYFCSNSALSDLDFQIAAHTSEDCKFRLRICFKKLITLKALNDEEHFDYLKWIKNCRQHSWPPFSFVRQKESENSVMLDICRYILVPLCRDVKTEKKFGSFMRTQQPNPSCDEYIKAEDIGIGTLDTWHGTPDLRVRGSEVVWGVEDNLNNEEVAADISDDESIPESDGPTTNIEGKITARTKNLAQAIGTCVVSSFTEKTRRKKLHQSVKNSLVPCVIIDKEKFRVILYDCEDDLLLITDSKLLATKGTLSQSSMAFLWIIFNHRYGGCHSTT